MENYSSDHGKQDVTELEFIVKDTKIMCIQYKHLQTWNWKCYASQFSLLENSSQEITAKFEYQLKPWKHQSSVVWSVYRLAGDGARGTVVSELGSPTHILMHMYSSTNYVIKISEFAYLNESKWY